ncbi:MAG: histidine kinase [Desulfitobacteriaceae bacterium]|nr:histidine kinase [Desulfitobacteriaceae bacterium]MDI6915006.1 histidine kinase [Desulfitobacteriaceae bacterium]
MIYSFFETNYTLLQFLYGLFFFLMGFAITLHIRIFRNSSNLPLASSLWLLAAFGIIHGLAEWAEVFIPIQSQYISKHTVRVFYIAEDMVVAVSFLFLFYFGVILSVNTLNKYQWLRFLPAGVFVFWLINFIAFPTWISPNMDWWMTASETWTRYLLAFPGAVLSSYALWLQYDSLKSSSNSLVAKNFLYAAMFFGLDALVAGLLVPKADFFPASVINVEFFFNTFQIPVHVFRTLCGIAIAVFMIRALEVFELEHRKNVDEARRLNLLCQERNRISRDLHDGIIQNIYAVGLHLENAGYLVKENAEEAQGQINIALKGLKDVVKNIRNYILDLQPTNFQEADLEKGLTHLIEKFRANSMVHVDFQVRGEATEVPLEICKHLYHITAEALNNIVKHSGANMIETALVFFPEKVELVISDNGQGFDTRILTQTDNSSTHRGLKNMADRSKLAKGTLEIQSERGKGTRIRVTVLKEEIQ